MKADGGLLERKVKNLFNSLSIFKLCLEKTNWLARTDFRMLTQLSETVHLEGAVRTKQS